MTEDPITWDTIKAFIDHTGHENYFAGRWTLSDSDLKFGDLVVTGLQCGNASDMAKYVGRVVQIRVGQGVFGSDVWLLRHPDGTLLSHENQGFWKLSAQDAEDVRTKYYSSEIWGCDSPETEYSICDQNPATGFIVPKPCGASEATCVPPNGAGGFVVCCISESRSKDGGTRK